MSIFRRASFFLVFIGWASHVCGQEQTPATHPWSDAVETRLAAAGTNRAEITKALTDTTPAHRDGMSFLVLNMPDADLQTLPAALLLTNVDLAYAAWDQSSLAWEYFPKYVF